MGHPTWTTNGMSHGATGAIPCGMYIMRHSMGRPIGNPACRMEYPMAYLMGHPVVHSMGHLAWGIPWDAL